MTQAAYRAAAVQLLKDYAAYADINLSVYPARPRTIMPPHAFVDRIIETFTPLAGLIDQGTPLVEVVVVHGLFDSMDAANQKDAFVDGFLPWVRERYHAAGANSLIRVSATEDLPDWVPDWIAPQSGTPPRTYYATQITLEGFRTD